MTQELRPVEVFSWKQVDTPVPKRNGTDEVVIQKVWKAVKNENPAKQFARFHRFCDWRDGEEAGPVAVIEFSDGSVDSFPLHLIKFLDTQA